MKKIPKLLKVVFSVLVIACPTAWMTYRVVKTQNVECEVCMEFGGKSQCRKAQGDSREACQRTAADNACAFLASGMTDSISCTSRPPVRVTF